ncbi:MAG: DUF362 domain-containing protein [Blautia sp.]|nr:DUF362 domain-containing protein [Blautia sp.]MDY5032420.1 DUF362 domain-containing protein [Blautia sp.]
MKHHVVVTTAPDMDFRNDYVALPQNYGTKEYFEREDVKSIFHTVFKNLDSLNEKTNISEKFTACERIYVKPNLVSVYHKSGMKDFDYPESTDPRVFDAVIAWLKQYQSNLVITESSGKPMPTRTSFKIAGYDRIARYRKTGLVALETCPVVRYLLPKAEVMKEVFIPEIYQDIVDKKACYVSVPKLKTNIYTGVTLGFKNAMGTIPYALRERNHNYYINKKLADLLYLFQPDLTVIDGIIGGEGNTPAPVDPVDSHVIISGTDSVETDKTATRIMGIDPDTIPLIQEAQKRGFGSDDTEVTGELPVFSFRRANPSLMDEEFHKTFPNILALAGHCLPHAPKVTDIHSVTPEIARQLELACDGGCLNALRSGFEYVIYAPKQNFDLPLAVIIGGGVLIDGKRYWFDRDGTPYEESDIRSLKLPVLTVGNCAERLNDIATYKTPGCCAPSVCMLAATGAMKIPFPLLSLKNESFFHFGLSAVQMVLSRGFQSLRGKWIDCPSEHKDQIYPVPDIPAQDQEKDYLEWPLPPMTWRLRLKMFMDQLRILKL